MVLAYSHVLSAFLRPVPVEQMCQMSSRAPRSILTSPSFRAPQSHWVNPHLASLLHVPSCDTHVEIAPFASAVNPERRAGKPCRAGREQFERMMEERRRADEPGEWKALRRGWCFGEEQFRVELLEQMAERMGMNHGGQRADGKLAGYLSGSRKRRGWFEAVTGGWGVFPWRHNAFCDMPF
jgi:hypothetical protein